jgi:hypothetical protein
MSKVCITINRPGRFTTSHLSRSSVSTYDLILNFLPSTAHRVIESLPPKLNTLAMYQPHYLGQRLKKPNYIAFWIRVLDKKASTYLKDLRLIAHLPDPRLLSSFTSLARERNVEVALTRARIEGMIR